MKLIIAYWQLQSRMIWRYRSVGHPVEVVQFSKQTVSVYGISSYDYCGLETGREIYKSYCIINTSPNVSRERASPSKLSLEASEIGNFSKSHNYPLTLFGMHHHWLDIRTGRRRELRAKISVLRLIVSLEMK